MARHRGLAPDAVGRRLVLSLSSRITSEGCGSMDERTNGASKAPPRDVAARYPIDKHFSRICLPAIVRHHPREGGSPLSDSDPCPRDDAPNTILRRNLRENVSISIFFLFLFLLFFFSFLPAEPLTLPAVPRSRVELSDSCWSLCSNLSSREYFSRLRRKREGN